MSKHSIHYNNAWGILTLHTDAHKILFAFKGGLYQRADSHQLCSKA